MRTRSGGSGGSGTSGGSGGSGAGGYDSRVSGGSGTGGSASEGSSGSDAGGTASEDSGDCEVKNFGLASRLCALLYYSYSKITNGPGGASAGRTRSGGSGESGLDCIKVVRATLSLFCKNYSYSKITNGPGGASAGRTRSAGSGDSGLDRIKVVRATLSLFCKHLFTFSLFCKNYSYSKLTNGPGGASAGRTRSGGSGDSGLACIEVVRATLSLFCKHFGLVSVRATLLFLFKNNKWARRRKRRKNSQWRLR